MLNGNLDAPPDIDFISVALPASLEVQVDYEGDATGVGTLENPLLGIYDSDCTLVESNDDIFSNPNSRVIFFVPDDGIVVLAATSCCDYDFVGAGSSNGSYVITIMNAPPFIGSISGRLVDVQNLSPLQGGPPQLGFVTLLRCEQELCQEEVAIQSTDAEGRFNLAGAPEGLRAGTYQIAVQAAQYEHDQRRLSEPFQVLAFVDFDSGDFLLTPNPVQIRNFEICDPVPADGGVCTYSMEVVNRGDKLFVGRAWSIVNYDVPDANFAFTFQAGARGAISHVPKVLRLKPHKAMRVKFRLRIPKDFFALERREARVFVEVGRSPHAVFNGVAGAFIGSIRRQPNSVSVLPDRESHQGLGSQAH
jgi:5-hydroxyisourate hydrolase-like protein (transthyretin family)